MCIDSSLSIALWSNRVSAQVENSDRRSREIADLKDHVNDLKNRIGDLEYEIPSLSAVSFAKVEIYLGRSPTSGIILALNETQVSETSDTQDL